LKVILGEDSRFGRARMVTFCDVRKPRVATRTILVAALALLGVSCAEKARKPVEGDKVITHVVAEGETLEEIADVYYGAPGRADEIRELNHMGREGIHPGDRLRVQLTPEDLGDLARREQARVPYNDAIELVGRGSYLDAIGLFKEAVELDPAFAEAWFNLGVAYQKIEAHKKALRNLERAVALRPDNADYQYALGSDYFHLESYAKAVRAFERALRADASHLKSQFSLAMTLEKQGKLDEARAAWERYLELDGKSGWAVRARSRLSELDR
jgi:tetratricopeptide (TPR) repeat protein